MEAIKTGELMPEYWGFYKREDKTASGRNRTPGRIGEILQGRNEPMMVKEPDYAKWREIIKQANTATQNGRFEIQKLALVISSKPKDMSQEGHRKLVAFITGEIGLRRSIRGNELSPVQSAIVNCISHNGLKKQLTEAFMNRKPLYPESVPSNREIEKSELSHEPIREKKAIEHEYVDATKEGKVPAESIAGAEEERKGCSGVGKYAEAPKSAEEVPAENPQATAYGLLALLKGYGVLGSLEEIHVAYENSVLTVTGPFEDVRLQDEFRCRGAVRSLLSGRFGFLPTLWASAPISSVWVGEKTILDPDDPEYMMPCSYFKIKTSATDFIIASRFELRLWGIDENEHMETMRYLESLRSEGQSQKEF